MVEPAGEKEQRHRAEVAEARPGWYVWLIMIVTSVLASGAAVYVSQDNQHQSEQAWCEILQLFDESARAAAKASPTNLRARHAVEAVARLRAAYDCPATS